MSQTLTLIQPFKKNLEEDRFHIFRESPTKITLAVI